MKAVQRLFSLAGLAPGTSFKRVDDQFPVCFKIFWQEILHSIPRLDVLKTLVFLFEGSTLILFLKARLWKCSAGYNWVLGLEGQPSCVTKGALSLFPAPWGLYGGTVSLLLPYLWEAEPCLASHMLYSSFTAPRGKGSDQNCGVPHTCSLFGCTLLYQHCLPGLKLVNGEKLVLLSPYISFSSFQD